MINLGNNIKSSRKKLGLTQEELAFQLGVTPQAVSRWESGAGMPDISMIVPLAQALSVSTDALFGMDKSSSDEAQYTKIKIKIEEIEKEYATPYDIALKQCEYLMDEVRRNPADHTISCFLVERTANLSRYIDRELSKDNETWKEFRDVAVRCGTHVIRFCDNAEWVERTHFGLSWIYIHEYDYNSAREHINALPSVANNRLRESLLAQLASFEYGIEGMKNVFRSNMQHFTRAINKEIHYAVQDMCFNDEPQAAIDLGLWGIEIIHTLSKNPDMLSYCRGFTRDIYKFIINADLRAEKYEDAAKHFNDLKAEMQHHFDSYHIILNSESESAKYTSRDLRYMEAYTQEFILGKQQDILVRLQEWNGVEKVEKMMGLIG